MATDVIMPALGMAQETGRLIAWRKAEGEPVAQGEPLFEVETDKVTVDIEAPASGVLAGLRAGAGEDVPVGHVIAVILAPGETLAPTAGAAQPAAPAPAPEATPQVVVSPVAQRIAAEHGLDVRAVKPAGGRVRKGDVLSYLRQQQTRLAPASPLARRMAAEGGVELAAVAGSGPEGAVLAADVRAFRAAPAPGPEAPAAPPAPASSNGHGPQPAAPAPSPDGAGVSTAWRVMAERLSQSWATVPHFYLLREVDATALLAWQARARERAAAKVTLSDTLVLLAAAALREHPALNGGWADGRLVRNSEINIGLAVAVEEGLLVPVIHRPDALRLGQVAARRADLVARAQTGGLRPDDLRGGSFTISNLGMFGVDAFNAIVNPPQAAILAVGRVAERVVPLDGQPAVRPMLTLSLSCDHRAVDGARAARFLDTLAAMIADPLRVME